MPDKTKKKKQKVKILIEVFNPEKPNDQGIKLDGLLKTEI